MHRTLKEATASPPRASRSAQQQAFNRFRNEYNFERPHQALDHCTPAELYCSSPRLYPRPLRVEYPEGYQTRMVRSSGEIKWRGQRYFIGQALYGEPVGIDQTDDRFFRVFFGPVPLATIDVYLGKVLRYSEPNASRRPGA